MVESRIELPDVPAELRKRVEAADGFLREHGAKLKGQTVKALWRVDAPHPASERVALALELGEVGLSFVVSNAELSDPKKMREAIRAHMWRLVTAFSDNNLDQIGRLLVELRADSAQER